MKESGRERAESARFEDALLLALKMKDGVTNQEAVFGTEVSGSRISWGITFVMMEIKR